MNFVCCALVSEVPNILRPVGALEVECEDCHRLVVISADSWPVVSEHKCKITCNSCFATAVREIKAKGEGLIIETHRIGRE